ncbi:hypothetical protein AGLY_016839 [Aphis glycines]|uniref:Uncharacterized protein n=1 Tax=Aphis glycines TaxID=307491 RepID=A0A6G0SWG0_APHGL|nr:hypothetical protein AGLY_016839 [Aphis glycines]
MRSNSSETLTQTVIVITCKFWLSSTGVFIIFYHTVQTKLGFTKNIFGILFGYSVRVKNKNYLDMYIFYNNYSSEKSEEVSPVIVIICECDSSLSSIFSVMKSISYNLSSSLIFKCCIILFNMILHYRPRKFYRIKFGMVRWQTGLISFTLSSNRNFTIGLSKTISLDFNQFIMSSFFQATVGTGSFLTEWYDALSITIIEFSFNRGRIPQNHSPPSTKPSAEPIWTTIRRLPLPDGFLGPVDSPFRNASL